MVRRSTRGTTSAGSSKKSQTSTASSCSKSSAKGKPTAQSDPPVPKNGSRITRSHAFFPFLKLPVEIRIQIYEYALPEYANGKVNECEREFDEPCFFDTSDALHPGDGWRGYNALLCTCKEIYEEAVDVLYNLTRSFTKKNDAGQRLFITDREITIRNYSMFCRKHLAYRTNVTGLFSKIRSLAIIITADEAMGMDLASDGYNINDTPAGLNDYHVVRDNVRWVVENLKSSKSLEVLHIDVQWKFMELGCDPPDLSEAEWLLEPFEMIRNVKNPHIHNLNVTFDPAYCENDLLQRTCLLEEFTEEIMEVVMYKQRMRELMSGMKRVKKLHSVFDRWYDFKRMMLRIYTYGKVVDVAGLMEEAIDARETEDAEAFTKVLEKVGAKWDAHMARNVELDETVKGLVKYH